MDAITIHELMQGLLPMTIVTSMVFGGAWVLTSIIAAFRHRAQLRNQADFHNKMLEKFGSAGEFAAYLQSEAGQRFFENLGSEPSTPLTNILGSIQKGVILSLLGLGLLMVSRSFTFENGGNAMFVIGVISLMIGLGFLISSAISYRLAKTWDLISAGNKRVQGEPGPAAS